jgi:hypothetical protein
VTRDRDVLPPLDELVLAPDRAPFPQAREPQILELEPAFVAEVEEPSLELPWFDDPPRPPEPRRRSLLGWLKR